METYDTDILTPSFVIYISKHHHHHQIFDLLAASGDRILELEIRAKPLNSTDTSKSSLFSNTSKGTLRKICRCLTLCHSPLYLCIHMYVYCTMYININ
jgi:hypothetical protein